MFKPPDHSSSPQSPVPQEPPASSVFARSHLVLGLLLLSAGGVGLAYGGRIESLARPEASEGLLAGLFGGLAASVGGVFQTMGWALVALGLPLGLAGWGLGRGQAWARRLTQLLGVLSAVLGIFLLTRLAPLEAILPLSYAGVVGWVMGRP